MIGTRRAIVALVAIATAWVGCTPQPEVMDRGGRMPTYQEGVYLIRLADVDPKGAVNGDVFSDSLLEASWTVDKYGFFVNLTAQSATTISVDWDDAYYVDIHGLKHEVVHSAESGDTTAREWIAPFDHLEPGHPSEGWSRLPLLPEIDASRDVLAEKAITFGTRVMRLVLPVQLDNETREYTFQFNVTIAPPK